MSEVRYMTKNAHAHIRDIPYIESLGLDALLPFHRGPMQGEIPQAACGGEYRSLSRR